MQHCYEQANHLNQVAIFTQPHARMHELVHSWQNGAAELLLSCVLRKKAAMHVTLVTHASADPTLAHAEPQLASTYQAGPQTRQQQRSLDAALWHSRQIWATWLLL
eukprot:CAMPEP_0202352054 /NCGR_PEP_ID=MMETSP1126-20121109/8414_1 /ASSEMBLY_ACC=CAM_ASM_000457 /TAXON_ID=3047 /ORGANISM="Dunaliella tertiolecta, Strain CCMP1320" /LENGTH=105 /DNA_ID=CAMNT_0048944217 /DNA_START=452 /DNA_END=770 /DNA_ORIENTATION=-